MIPFVLNSNGVPFAKYNAFSPFSLRFNMRMFIKLISQKWLPSDYQPWIVSRPILRVLILDEVAALLIAKRGLLRAKSSNDALNMRVTICDRVKDIAMLLPNDQLDRFPKELSLPSQKGRRRDLTQSQVKRSDGIPSILPDYLKWNERIHNRTSKEEGPDQPAASKTSCLDAWKESAIFARMPCPDELGLSFPF